MIHQLINGSGNRPDKDEKVKVSASDQSQFLEEQIISSDNSIEIISDGKIIDLKSIGGGGSLTRYIHVQSTPSQVWNVLHNLNTLPTTVVVDENHIEIHGQVYYLNNMNLQLIFAVPVSGWCYCL